MVSIFIDDNRLVVEYGEDKNVVMELETDEERELIQMLLDDVNLWANFLSSLSSAMKQQIGRG